MEKYRRLIQDYEKDEAQRLINLRKGFAKYFRISQEEVIELMDNFDGSLEELHNHIEQISNTKLAA
jgi:energy-converting hydrogenase A subunit M